MSGILRQLVFLILALGLSWWLVFDVDAQATPAPGSEALPPVSLTPIVASEPAARPAAEASTPEPAPAPEANEALAATAPPTTELGRPDGDPEAAPKKSTAPEASAAEERQREEHAARAEAEAQRVRARQLERQREREQELERERLAEAEAQAAAQAARAEEQQLAEIERLMSTDALLATAREELAGESPKGFATVLLAAPEDQLAIARFFGEELLLVPKEALNPEAGPEDQRYFRIASEGSPRVVPVEGPAPLERFRRYRDLFDYEYARLPEPVRDLRRSVLGRDDVFLFAALIPPREWALAIGRRREALAASGRDLAEVERFVLRYRRAPRGTFDLAVEEIVFADGTRTRP